MMVKHYTWLGSFVIFYVVGTSIAKKPYVFVIYQGGGGGLDPQLLSGFVHVKTNTFCSDTMLLWEYISARYIHFKVSLLVVEPYNCHKATPCLGTNRE